MTAWDEYVMAAQRLDTVRRIAAAVVAEQTAAHQAASEELTSVRTRLQLQQGRLLDAGRQAGVSPVLVPGTGELEAARVALGPADSPQAIRAALAGARMSLDSADAVLSGVADAVANPSSPALRNSLVYGGYALLAAVLQALGFLAANEAGGTGILVLGCGLGLPLVVFGLGWLTVGALPAPPGAVPPGAVPPGAVPPGAVPPGAALPGAALPGAARRNRTPLLGAALSLLSLVPMLGMVVWILAQTVGR